MPLIQIIHLQIKYTRVHSLEHIYVISRRMLYLMVDIQKTI
nr:MAG TPA: hypothetical protein [Caudoviricetes sp.]